MTSTHISKLTKAESEASETQIEWGISHTPVGNMLVAKSEQGIVYLSFFETSQADCYEQMTRDWPLATLKQNDRFASELSHQIFQPKSTTPPELHLQGTNFQLKVWHSLLDIPSGETASYSQLAKRIGKPGSARAVGNAVGKNRIAYLIPCHRVIREDRSLGGYRWGTACKSKILAWESKARTA